MITATSSHRFEEGAGYAILTLMPELNDVQWTEIEKVGNEVIAQLEGRHPPALIVDLSPLSYMGSAMVALIVRLWKTTKQNGGRMVVVIQHELVHEVVNLAGLDKVWTITNTRDAAIQSLGHNPAQSRRKIGFLLCGVGALAIVTAIAGLVFILNPRDGLDANVPLAVTFASATIGLIVGSISVIRNAGGMRVFGIVVIAFSLLVLVTGILNWPIDGRRADSTSDFVAPTGRLVTGTY